MGLISIPISGITTTSVYKDGDSYSLVNLRDKNNSLHPVAPRGTIKELSDTYDMIFVHQNSGYENWIGVKHSGDRSSVYSGIDGTRVLVQSDVEKISSIQQVGNTLSLVTESNVFYMLYLSPDYVFLGEIPEIPFTGIYSEEEEYATMRYSELYGTSRISINLDETVADYNKNIKAAISYMINIIKTGGTMNGVTYQAQPGVMFDAHLLRFAYKLYDGTYSKHSPVLLS